MNGVVKYCPRYSFLQRLTEFEHRQNNGRKSMAQSILVI